MPHPDPRPIAAVSFATSQIVANHPAGPRSRHDLNGMEGYFNGTQEVSGQQEVAV